MKRAVSLFLAVVTLCCLCACGQTAEPDFGALTKSVSDSVPTLGNMVQVDAAYIENRIGLAPDNYSDGLVMTTNVGTSRDEFGVFKCADEKTAAAAGETLEAYIQQCIDTMMGYTPEELPKLESAQVTVKGKYVMYAVLGDEVRPAAIEAFSASFK